MIYLSYLSDGQIKQCEVDDRFVFKDLNNFSLAPLQLDCIAFNPFTLNTSKEASVLSTVTIL